MKPQWILLLLFLVACQPASMGGVQISGSMKECGSDEACFVANAKSCTPAHFYKSGSAGSTEQWIQGWQGDMCITEMKLTTTDKQVSELICKFPRSYLQNWQQGTRPPQNACVAK